MSKKTLIMGGMIVGSYAGSFIPVLWGDTSFSLTTVLLSTVGGVLGIWFAFVIGKNF